MATPLPTVQTDWTADTLAQEERLRLGLGDKPVDNIRDLLEQLGVLVFFLVVPDNEFAGLSWHHATYGPCMLVNLADIPGRRTFTSAHEYAHLLRRDGDSVCDLELDRGDERYANRFATVFLMPSADVIDSFHRRGLTGRIPSDKELGSLAGRYRVSLQAMGLRLEELGLVPPGTASSAPSRWEKFRPGSLGRRRPDWRRRVGETFTSRALEAYSSGRISVGKLARYLDIDIRKALELVEANEGPNEDEGAEP